MSSTPPQTVPPAPVPAPSSARDASEDDEQATCAVCHEPAADGLQCACTSGAICHACALRLDGGVNLNPRCPVCRERLLDFSRIDRPDLTSRADVLRALGADRGVIRSRQATLEPTVHMRAWRLYDDASETLIACMRSLGAYAPYDDFRDDDSVDSDMRNVTETSWAQTQVFVARARVRREVHDRARKHGLLDSEAHAGVMACVNVMMADLSPPPTEDEGPRASVLRRFDAAHEALLRGLSSNRDGAPAPDADTDSDSDSGSEFDIEIAVR